MPCTDSKGSGEMSVYSWNSFVHKTKYINGQKKKVGAIVLLPNKST